MLTWLIIVILLFVAGVVLLALEAFVIPGFGVVGILGIGAFVGAAVIAWLQLGWLEGVASLVASVGVLGLLLWYAPRSKTAKGMILQESVRSTAAVLPAEIRPGVVGVAVTALRPAGLAEFADRTVDVVSDGLFLDPGTRLRIKHVEGSRVVVEPAPDFLGG